MIHIKHYRNESFIFHSTKSIKFLRFHGISELMRYLTAIITTILLLLASTLEMPYGFYIILRFVVFAYSIYCIYNLVAVYGSKINYVIIPIFVSILYNPIVRIHLYRDLWSVINLVTIVAVWYPYLFKKYRDRIL